jgi:hypothetical protein
MFLTAQASTSVLHVFDGNHFARNTFVLLQESSVELPVELVEAISRRSHGVVEFPNEVEGILEDALASGRKRQLRLQSAALQQELQKRSRSTSRGGINILPPLSNVNGGEEGEHQTRKEKVQMSFPFY